MKLEPYNIRPVEQALYNNPRQYYKRFENTTFVISYKGLGSCIKYTKTYTNPRHLLNCIRKLEEGNYYYDLYKRVD